MGNPSGRSSAVFASLNIRSLLNKFDDVNELCRDRRVDLFCITESWHDADSAVLGRFRSAGYSVVINLNREPPATICLSTTVVLWSSLALMSHCRRSPLMACSRHHLSRCAFMLLLVDLLPSSSCCIALVQPPYSRSFSTNSAPSSIELLPTRNRYTWSATSASGLTASITLVR